MLFGGLRNARGDDAAAAEFFEKQVRPLLIEKCQSCHQGEKPGGGLRMSGRAALLSGGDSGPAIVSGKPDQSLLMRAVGYVDEPKMPPKQKLPAADVAKLRQWIASGAYWPNEKSPPSVPSKDVNFQVTTAQRQWWAFQPPRRSPLPRVKDSAWPHNEIDRFVLAAMEARGMRPERPADRRVWLRRATFDLTGLPTTPEEVEAFVRDPSTDAYEKVVDRLLSSPAYGQRWARHWLDVVRYADYHDGDPAARDKTCEPLEAWRYRDWVVSALNSDLPYDSFIRHQIAGDLLPSPDGRDFYADGLVATTFLTNGSWDRGDADKEKMVSDMVDDQIDTIGKAFLGITLGCARCHHHKFDPISQHDYYALAGIFYSTRILQELGAKGGNYTLLRIPLASREYVARRAAQLKELSDLGSRLAELDKKSPKPPPNDPARQQLTQRQAAVQAELLPEPPLAEAAQEGGTPGGLFPKIQDVPLHIRGSYTRLGPIVPRRLPEFLASGQQVRVTRGSGRRELADWIASPENTLTARVIVNRLWQGHFGAGLVPTASNFGLTSEPPSHPGLLDWLALRFIDDGWSLKKLHRRIMLSAAYRQASVVSREQMERDPDNRWLGRFPTRRLEAEAFRDAMLSVSGLLDESHSGPAAVGVASPRRSIYVQTARWDRGSFATLFDAANPDASVEQRSVSTVAPQALFLLNHDFTRQQARRLAKRLLHSPASESTAAKTRANETTVRIQQAFQILFARPARPEEIDVARQVLGGESSEAAWTELAHVLLCSNEFVYLD